jgi:tRNA modification GTPase
MNGRIDLTQAEGVRDTVEARTDAQLRQGNLLREGALKAAVNAVRDKLTGVLASVEAATDFSEEIGELDRAAALAEVDVATSQAEKLLSTLEAATTVREGTTVAIVGRPNVGKSSLLNAVAHAERAIVTDVPGTTRDTVTEVIAVHGHLVRFVDTAGLRDTDDVVEKIGVERSRDASLNAEHVWFVFDTSVGWTEDDERELRKLARPATLVGNKSDLPEAPDSRPAAKVSAKSGEGLAELLAMLSTDLQDRETPLVNQRHGPLLAEALGALAEVRDALTQHVPDDLAAVGLRAAVRALGEITGETAPPDIIERVFHDFCIGK